VSSSMTSFTQCSGTSFTLPHERSPRGSAIENDLEECGRSGTAGAFCGGGGARRKRFPDAVPGVRYLAAHGIFMAAALPGTGAGGHRRAQPASASESGAKPQTSGNSSGGLRQRYPDWGARKLQVLLARREWSCRPAPSIAFCCGEVWCARGIGMKRRCNGSSGPPNQLWQMDFKGSKGMGPAGGSVVTAGRSQPAI